FYAWLDTGQYQAARQYAERQTRNIPWSRDDFGSPTPHPNHRLLNRNTLSINYLLGTHHDPETENLANRMGCLLYTKHTPTEHTRKLGLGSRR
ncbi:hypothetical protein, partial [Enterobacter sichuanensis]